MEYTAYTAHQLGETLRAHRKAKNLTQQQTASNVGLLPKTISKLERTPETATLESLYKLLSALELELVIRDKTATTDKSEW